MLFLTSATDENIVNYRPSFVPSTLCWNSSSADFSPKGRWRNQYQPKTVLNVVNTDDSSVSFKASSQTWHPWRCSSHVAVKYTAPDTWEILAVCIFVCFICIYFPCLEHTFAKWFHLLHILFSWAAVFYSMSLVSTVATWLLCGFLCLPLPWWHYLCISFSSPGVFSKLDSNRLWAVCSWSPLLPPPIVLSCACAISWHLAILLYPMWAQDQRLIASLSLLLNEYQKLYICHKLFQGLISSLYFFMELVMSKYDIRLRHDICFKAILVWFQYLSSFFCECPCVVNVSAFVAAFFISSFLFDKIRKH